MTERGTDLGDIANAREIPGAFTVVNPHPSRFSAQSLENPLRPTLSDARLYSAEKETSAKVTPRQIEWAKAGRKGPPTLRHPTGRKGPPTLRHPTALGVRPPSADSAARPAPGSGPKVAGISVAVRLACRSAATCPDLSPRPVIRPRHATSPVARHSGEGRRRCPRGIDAAEGGPAYDALGSVIDAHFLRDHLLRAIPSCYGPVLVNSEDLRPSRALTRPAS